MISVEEAKKRIAQHIRPTASVRCSLDEAEGSVLSEPVVCPIDMPPFGRSAMDGYAVSHSDVHRGVELRLAGTVSAGDNGKVLIGPGEASRIYTGASLPEGSDAVIMQEKVKREGGRVLPQVEEIQEGENVRRQGEELRAGELALEAGHMLTPGGIGFLASMGMDRVQVYQSPKVAVMASGDELVAPGGELSDGAVFESNSYSLVALLRSKGFDIVRFPAVRDDLESTVEAIGKALDKVDVLLLSGGISVGDKDHMRNALERSGVREVFHKVAQKPGKPIFFGVRDKKACFALPGNPAACLVGAYEYVLPYLRGCIGVRPAFGKVLCLPVLIPWEKGEGRAVFLRARITPEGVMPLDGQSSAMMHAFAQADALIYLPAEAGRIDKGTYVEVHPL